ncbi:MULTISPECIES: hypothetical protein [Paracoccus]|uniref:Uncharacterized protein n=1 Tax=Paracoccus kondratievae TaxID=135740 RepID=A0AAD3P194_9RHOB|nr:MULTISPECIES: hypothetical protein [Paracoccus]GLK65013.1 hypothetical protein GCM10017635_24840 [Paracoccus kondratievae]SMG54546.1 hypothetical protein SAMN02746000_03590 [Paracoccus sp. J56]
MYGTAYDPGFIAFLSQEGEVLSDREESRLGQALAVFWALVFLCLMVM